MVMHILEACSSRLWNIFERESDHCLGGKVLKARSTIVYQLYFVIDVKLKMATFDEWRRRASPPLKISFLGTPSISPKSLLPIAATVVMSCSLEGSFMQNELAPACHHQRRAIATDRTMTRILET